MVGGGERGRRRRRRPPGLPHEQILEGLGARGDGQHLRAGGQGFGQKRRRILIAGQGDLDPVALLAHLRSACGGVVEHRGRGLSQPQLGLHDAGRQQLRQRAEVAELPLNQDSHAIADHLHVAEDVAGKDHGLSLLPQLGDDVADLLAPQGVEPRQRLVEHHQVGIVHQRLGQADALEHALGELAQRSVERLGQPHPLDEGVDAGGPCAARHATQPRGQLEELVGAQVFVKRRVLWQVAQPPLYRHVGHPVAEHVEVAAGRKDEPHHHLDGGGLARAVGPQQAEDLARPDLQAQPAHGLHPAGQHLGVELGAHRGAARARQGPHRQKTGDEGLVQVVDAYRWLHPGGVPGRRAGPALRPRGRCG